MGHDCYEFTTYYAPGYLSRSPEQHPEHDETIYQLSTEFIWDESRLTKRGDQYKVFYTPVEEVHDASPPEDKNSEIKYYAHFLQAPHVVSISAPGGYEISLDDNCTAFSITFGDPNPSDPEFYVAADEDESATILNRHGALAIVTTNPCHLEGILFDICVLN